MGDVSNVTGAIAGVAGLASAAVNPAVTIPIAAVIVFAAWAYGVYRAT